MTQWYYTNGRSKHGPIDEAGVRLRAQRGYIRRDTLLWHAGLQGWTSATELGFFPDDDVEPTMCAIPVPGEPPPIPQASPVGQSPVPLPSPVQPTYRPAPGPAPAPSQFDGDETRPTMADDSFGTMSQPPRSSDASAPQPGGQSFSAQGTPPTEPPPQPPVAPVAPVQVSLNAPMPEGGNPVGVADWFWTFLIMCIPLVNLIMILVWAFGGGAPVSKRNWAKAVLLWMLIGILLTILFWGAIFGSLASSMR